MARGDTRHGRSGPATPRNLGYVRVVITIPCDLHTEHSAVMEGPYLKVRDLVGMFAQAAGTLGVWVLTEWTALDGEVPMSLGEWEPKLTGPGMSGCT